MSLFSSFTAAGVASIQLGIVDINGIPYGTAGIGTSGAVTPLATLPFAKKFGGLIPNPVRVTALGENNRDRHEYIFNPATTGELAISQHALDLDQYAAELGIKKVTDNNAYRVGIQTNAPVNAKQAAFMVNVDAQQAGLAGFGFKKFIQEVYPLVTMTPLLANLAEVAVADWAFYGIPTQSSQTPWGTAYTTATDGYTRGAGFIETSDYPKTWDVFGPAVGAETTFDLTFTPAVPHATYVTAWKFAGGVWTSFSISSVTGKTLTFAALTAGDIIFVRYESTDFLQSI